MELILTRKIHTEESTIGELALNGEFFCHTLEDKDRFLDQSFTEEQNKSLKVYAETAIPTGKYNVIINYSQRFKRLLPLLLEVSAFEGIRIHPGNKAVDSHGCILVGEHKEEANMIVNSRATFAKLFKILSDGFNKNEPITIQIKQDDITPTRIYPEKPFNPWDIF